ncbi:MAG TPA: GGDEF domain-containing protein [Dokdonella sp.]|uniref:GGDEF domain-containing protein n=1 Tax=Dokdonella sp. TaxID=2291710 RepID=UPI002D7E3006|nr:GGDEF domain-containing protein [Dokdonella sp.]HET9033643.1 GGDEF domain-containing protein [Dokdonella sp.]
MNFLNLSLDIPTITISRALIQAMLAGLLIHVGSQQERGDAPRFWALGLLLNGVALFLFVVDVPADWERVVTTGNHLAMGASSACFLLGFWRFAGQPANPALVTLMIVIPLIALLAWELLWPNARLRILFTAFGQALFLLALQHILTRPPRSEVAMICRRLRVIVIVYLLIFVWSYASIAGILPTSARLEATYHRALFSMASLLFMLSLAVACLALQFALLAARASDLAMIDWHTGLLNRRGFFRAIGNSEQQRSESGGTSSIILIDIDQFKSINDRFGHASGDSVLKVLADLLLEQSDDKHLVARTGGEEFCIVLPEGDQQDALALAETIRESSSRANIAAVDGRRIRFTISAGTCEILPGQSFDEALIRADNALYVAKREGRNRVRQCAEAA